MKMTLELFLFGGALGEVSLPAINPDDPFQAGLILEEFDEPVGVEILEVVVVKDLHGVLSVWGMLDRFLPVVRRVPTV